MPIRLPMPGSNRRRPRRGGKMGSFKIRLVIALVIAGFALISYLSTSSTNPFTGQQQRVGLTPADEVALGLQAVPSLTQQFGGVEPDPEAQARLDRIGRELVEAAKRHHGTAESPYEFEFTLLADDQVVNAFALPGGQTFITDVLHDQLSDSQLAAVMAHEITHVIQRHGAQQMAQGQFFQQLSGAAGMATGDVTGAQIAAQFLDVLGKGYSREHERECDHHGVHYMVEAGYHPQGMVELLQILAEASGGAHPPEMLSTHPHPEERVGLVEQQIKQMFPNGVPSGLIR
ncbi:M48 family metalloprotease [Algisphaera agarilytica]|uniref:Putative Zn-dependent protease n=1 Tax=Algisphaera agarilytica TaxID=1385975 RepID=A0A7X0H670_9BACT|nr:M48 family metalloprotease [Algisphaera agarilytica]MBB6430046.1 putative Zn-dependent protease [Algisphaera agarilytica]